MELYIRQGCPYCAKVLEFADQNGIEFNLRDISEEGVAEELIARGGKQQVPYLVDTDSGEEMYESDDIIEYLKKNGAGE